MSERSTILIVDDDPDGREVLASLLNNSNYHLAFATHGIEAIKLATHLLPDLILLDVMMPGMDGFQVCKHLRGDAILSGVPIIMVTALDDDASRLQGIEAGADDFISKPYNRTELRARVRTITRLNRYQRLLAERARFEWVVEQSPDGYLLVNEHDQIIYFNTAAQKYLHLPDSQSVQAHDSLQESFRTLVHKHYQCEPQEMWAAWPYTAPQQSDTHEASDSSPANTPSIRPSLYLVRPETSTAQALWLQVESINLPAGMIAGHLIRLRDVTEHMAKKLDMWTFHALLFHKMRTPLTGLVGSLQLLRDDSLELSSSERREFSHIALQSAQRLHRQIEDILRYLNTSKLAQPGDEYDLTSLPSLLEELMNELELDTVVLSGHEQLNDVLIVLSKQAVELIFRQILANAKKFHPSHSPNVQIHVTYHNTTQVTICVYDDGKTLTSEQIAQAWTPYYQGEKNMSGEVPGMGLGLAIVAALIWQTGGHYRLANRESGPGVMVELTVPLVQKAG